MVMIDGVFKFLNSQNWWLFFGTLHSSDFFSKIICKITKFCHTKKSLAMIPFIIAHICQYMNPLIKCKL